MKRRVELGGRWIGALITLCLQPASPRNFLLQEIRYPVPFNLVRVGFSFTWDTIRIGCFCSFCLNILMMTKKSVPHS